MNKSDKLVKTECSDGAIVYDLNNLIEDIGFYEAIRVATADLLDLPSEKPPMGAGEDDKPIEKFLSKDIPDRFQNQYIGVEYMGKYNMKIHSDGTMVVKDIEDSEYFSE